MKYTSLHRGLALVFAGCLAAASLSVLAAPKGAKAIFDSGGGGGTIGMSVNAPRPATPSAEPVADKYVGISYQILTIGEDGQMRPVSKSRTFRSGERVRILASTNRPGYLTVANIGTSGRMTVLFSEYVEARRLTQIPQNSNLRFDSNPGTENILIMLSNEPSPLAAPANQTVSAPPPPPSYPAQVSAPPPPPAYPAQVSAPYVPPPPMPDSSTQTAGASVPPYPALPPDQASASLVASLEGAKSLKAKGSKDLMVEDSMNSSFAVVSPKQGGYKAVSGGAKDLIMESSTDGMNYGLVPVSAVSGGGILTLEIKLKHR